MKKVFFDYFRDWQHFDKGFDVADCTADFMIEIWTMKCKCICNFIYQLETETFVSKKNTYVDTNFVWKYVCQVLFKLEEILPNSALKNEASLSNK